MLKYELQEAVIVASLYIILLAVTFVKRKTFKRFTYKKLVTSLNYSLKYGIIIFITLIILLIAQFCVNSVIGEILFDVLCEYIIIAFFYLPILFILNLPFLSRFIRITVKVIRRQNAVRNKPMNL